MNMKVDQDGQSTSAKNESEGVRKILLMGVFWRILIIEGKNEIWCCWGCRQHVRTHRIGLCRGTGSHRRIHLSIDKKTGNLRKTSIIPPLAPLTDIKLAFDFCVDAHCFEDIAEPAPYLVRGWG
jgi:hypothetical protein